MTFTGVIPSYRESGSSGTVDLCVNQRDKCTNLQTSDTSKASMHSVLLTVSEMRLIYKRPLGNSRSRRSNLVLAIADDEQRPSVSSNSTKKQGKTLSSLAAVRTSATSRRFHGLYVMDSRRVSPMSDTSLTRIPDVRYHRGSSIRPLWPRARGRSNLPGCPRKNSVPFRAEGPQSSPWPGPEESPKHHACYSPQTKECPLCPVLPRRVQVA